MTGARADAHADRDCLKLERAAGRLAGAFRAHHVASMLLLVCAGAPVARDDACALASVIWEEPLVSANNMFGARRS